MTLPILHTGSDRSPTESSFLLLVTSTASFCEKTALSAIGSRTTWTPFDRMWQSERCRSEAQKGKKDLCDLIFWVWQTFSVQILCWRGQGDKVSTDSLDTQYCWVCSPAIPKARPGTAQCLLQCREHSWKAARTRLHQFCSLWPDQSLHTTQRTLTPETPHYHHISRMFSFMLLECHSDGLVFSSYTILNTEMEKKYVSIIGGEAPLDISQYALSLGPGTSSWPSCTLQHGYVLSAWLQSLEAWFIMTIVLFSVFTLNSLKLNAFFLHVGGNAVQ